MTAASFAELVNARRIGAGKWQARCPAHDDRHPSLSIRQGGRGVLLKCWSHGCTVEGIMAALHLPTSALFDGPQLTSEQRADATRQRTVHDAEQRRQRAADRAKRDRVFKLENLRNAIGGKLARSPDDRELGRLFHQVCEKWHEAEAALYPVAPELGGLRMETPAATPPDVAAALADIGQSFDKAKGPFDAGLERIV